MNCANHPDAPAVAYCRTCGKPLCGTCSRDVRGVVYCEECLASHLAGTMPPAAAGFVPPAGERPPGTPSPSLATILGFIPGVGAMYNGEFGKGFVHVLIFATLIWMTDHVNGLFGLAIAAFYIYMPIEAYKTARAREMGLPAPDPLGLNNLFRSGPPPAPAASVPVSAASAPGSAATGTPGDVPQADATYEEEPHSRVPVGAFILIGLGVLFLLGEIGALHFDWLWRFWPLILIAIGVRILMQRQRRGW
jgi:TM2 domain-containing membrane protein YozV